MAMTEWIGAYRYVDRKDAMAYCDALMRHTNTILDWHTLSTLPERSSMERQLTLSSHSASSAIYTGPNGECLVIPISVFPTDFVSIQLPKSITINAEGGPGTDWEVIPKR